jgi:isopropylmalate/homocitrate/citramalate synthase
MVDDVKRAVDCGVSGLVMEIPSSEHIIEKAYRWSLEKAIDLSIESTSYAHSQGLEVVFFPIDFTRAEINWVLNLITKVAEEGHMDALGLVDTFGACSPHAMQFLVRQVKSRINKRLECHFHMDFGLGIANTLMALAEGVEVMHTTVLGIGERAGNVPMEETVLSLKMMYGIDTGVRLDKLYSTAKLVEKLAGLAVPTQHPIVGRRLFHVESGIIASWLQNCRKDDPVELFPYRWDIVGQLEGPQIVLGKGSGVESIKYYIEKLGYEATDDEVARILADVKESSLSRKALLSENEFSEIADKVLLKKV